MKKREKLKINEATSFRSFNVHVAMGGNNPMTGKYYWGNPTGGGQKEHDEELMTTGRADYPVRDGIYYCESQHMDQWA